MDIVSQTMKGYLWQATGEVLLVVKKISSISWVLGNQICQVLNVIREGWGICLSPVWLQKAVRYQHGQT